MKTRTKIITAGLAALAVTGGVGATIASADTPTPAPSTSPSPDTTADAQRPGAAKGGDQRKHRTLQARALHGEVTLGGKDKQRVLDFQRGTVSEVSATSITITSVDGYAATYVVDAKTKVRKDKELTSIADVEKADRVRVLARQDGDKLTAKVIRNRG